jgi:hypothetical protein
MAQMILSMNCVLIFFLYVPVGVYHSVLQLHSFLLSKLLPMQLQFAVMMMMTMMHLVKVLNHMSAVVLSFGVQLLRDVACH